MPSIHTPPRPTALGAPMKRREILYTVAGALVLALGGGTYVFASEDEQRFTAQLLVGGVSSLVTTMVGEGRMDQLAGLRGPLMTLFERLQ